MKYKIKLSTVTTYKFGGYCNNFYKISNNDIDLFDEAFSNKEYFILGKGSNVAFSDKDYEGNVINPDFNEISFIKNSGEVKVGSSVFLPDIARFYKDKNLINAEFLIGIPGSVGGAVKMNAGAYGWEFSDILSSIEVYNLVTKKIETLDKDDINFSYRSSSNLENKVIISATLIGTEGDPALIKSRLKENIKYRKDTQPSAIYNAGSVFKNTDQYSAGELIDKAELKGFSIDGVKVSTKHANFFVASKGANSSSLYKLVNHVKEVVDSKFGVSLQKEILFVGKFD
jgi:UDP-N-acetylmuramate dehydrogenase